MFGAFVLLAGVGAGALLLTPVQNRAAPAPSQSPAPAASNCAILPADLEPALSAIPGASGVTRNDAVDPDSGEPVRRNRVAFGDGQALEIEQKNCVIANLKVTALSPLAAPDAAAQARIAAVLKAWPQWKANFAMIDPASFVKAELASPDFTRGLAEINGRKPPGGEFTYASQALPPTGETSETLVTLQSSAPTADGVRSRFTLTISTGE